MVPGDDRRGLGVHRGEAVAEDLLLRRALRALGPALDLIGQRLEHLLHGVPGLVPVRQRLVAKRVAHRLQGVDQFGAGIEEALARILGDLEAQAQRAQHGDAAVAEVGVVEHAAGLAVRHGTVFAGDGVERGLIEVAALVTQAALHRRVARAGVDELDPALAVGGLAVADHPDEGADAGVVEHLLGQGDDGFEHVALDDPAPDVALAAAGTAGKQRRAVEHDGRTRTGQVLVARHVVGKLADHVQQEEQSAVVDARQLAAVAAEVGPEVDHLLLGLPVHAEGGVGEQVVERRHVGKAIVDQGVAEFDAAVALALDQQVGGGDGIRARVVVLAIDLDRGLLVVGADPVLRLGQHAAGAAGGVADGDDDAGLGEHAGVGLQQQVDHELDDFARGEVIAGRFVGGFVEAPDQVLEHQTHGDVVDLAGVQVDLGELGNHLI